MCLIIFPIIPKYTDDSVKKKLFFPWFLRNKLSNLDYHETGSILELNARRWLLKISVLNLMRFPFLIWYHCFPEVSRFVKDLLSRNRFRVYTNSNEWRLPMNKKTHHRHSLHVIFLSATILLFTHQSGLHGQEQDVIRKELFREIEQLIEKAKDRV